MVRRDYASSSGVPGGVISRATPALAPDEDEGWDEFVTELEYVTTASSMEILEELYRNDPGQPWFTITIVVPVRAEDFVTDGTLDLELRRKFNERHNFALVNGDRIYRTTGRFKGHSEDFVVDVIIRSRVADLLGASVILSSDALHAFERFLGGPRAR